MAAWLRVFLLLLFPFALAEAEIPCDGFEVLEGYGMENLEAPAGLGVRVISVEENVESDQACWEKCCEEKRCDLAIRSQETCHLLTCKAKDFDTCELTVQEGARSFKRVDAGSKPTREDFCISKAETGSCRASFLRWWYDVEDQSCKNFTYGGCPENLNNHPGEEECMAKCKGVSARMERNEPPTKPTEASNLDELCSGPSVTGRCRAAFPRWYFDSESQSCRLFTYGGCGGSKNNHLTEQACTDNCVVTKPEPAQVNAPKVGNFKEYCAAPPVTGHCRAAFTRYYYDPILGTCNTFTYGGCRGNKNNYLNADDCQKMCASRSEDDDHSSDHNVLHRPLTAVVLPILLALLAATLLGVMIYSFVKVSKRNQETADFRAMWNPIDDKECLMNNAYTL